MAEFHGTGADETYNGTEDTDEVYGNGGKDTLNGNGGSDHIDGGTRADTIQGGDGDDFLSSYVRDPNFIFWGAGTQSLDVFAERDTLIGGEGDDHFAAGYGDDVDGGPARTGCGSIFWAPPKVSMPISPRSTPTGS